MIYGANRVGGSGLQTVNDLGQDIRDGNAVPGVGES